MQSKNTICLLKFFNKRELLIFNNFYFFILYDFCKLYNTIFFLNLTKSFIFNLQTNSIFFKKNKKFYLNYLKLHRKNYKNNKYLNLFKFRRNSFFWLLKKKLLNKTNSFSLSFKFTHRFFFSNQKYNKSWFFIVGYLSQKSFSNIISFKKFRNKNVFFKFFKKKKYFKFNKNFKKINDFLKKKKTYTTFFKFFFLINKFNSFNKLHSFKTRKMLNFLLKACTVNQYKKPFFILNDSKFLKIKKTYKLDLVLKFYKSYISLFRFFKKHRTVRKFWKDIWIERFSRIKKITKKSSRLVFRNYKKNKINTFKFFFRKKKIKKYFTSFSLLLLNKNNFVTKFKNNWNIKLNVKKRLKKKNKYSFFFDWNERLNFKWSKKLNFKWKNKLILKWYAKLNMRLKKKNTRKDFRVLLNFIKKHKLYHRKKIATFFLKRAKTLFFKKNNYYVKKAFLIVKSKVLNKPPFSLKHKFYFKKSKKITFWSLFYFKTKIFKFFYKKIKFFPVNNFFIKYFDNSFKKKIFKYYNSSFIFKFKLKTPNDFKYKNDYKTSHVFNFFNTPVLKSRSKSLFLTSVTGFFYTYAFYAQNFFLDDNNLTSLRKTITSFIVKNEINRYILKKYSYKNYFYFNNEEDFLYKDFFFCNLFEKKSMYFLKKKNHFLSSINSANLNPYFEHFNDNNDNNDDDDDFYSVKKIKFKPGYSIIWRKARHAFKNAFNLKFKYQKKLTKYLVNFYKYIRLNFYLYLELQIKNIIIKSKLLPDVNNILFYFKNNFFFVNGIICNNPNFQLVVGDFIQLIISIKYYILYKWLLSFSLKRQFRLRHYSYYKKTDKVYDHGKKKSNYYSDWVKKTKFLNEDSVKFAEIDFFTLSIFIIYEPFLWSEIDPTFLITNRFLIANMHNWKYIN